MSSTLFIDEGNSRIKYWLMSDETPAVLGHAQDLQTLVASLLSARVTHIVLATVKSREELLARLDELCGPSTQVTWVDVTPRILPTHYHDPRKLGIDRWLGVLAARYLGSQYAIVVDAGTAATIDVYEQSSGHLGGYILPGLSMQQASLAAHTARVNFPDADWTNESLGTDTAAAVGHGSIRSLCALIREMAAASSTNPDVYLTGGNASVLAEFLPFARVESNLVQIGMQAFLHYSGGKP